MTWKHEGSRHERGYDYRWTQRRLVVLRRDNYLCQPCQRQGRVAEATEVDHITPKAQDGEDDYENLQSICRDCHAAKTKSERDAAQQKLRDEGKRRVGEDGWPIEPKRWGYGIPHGVRQSAKPLTIVCGPPASGKTTYVNEHAGKRDKVICLDRIKARLCGNERTEDRKIIAQSLRYRDMMIRALADEPFGQAWLITTAGSPEERAAWIDALGPKVSIIAMDTPRAICIQRAKEDPARAEALPAILKVIEGWH